MYFKICLLKLVFLLTPTVLYAANAIDALQPGLLREHQNWLEGLAKNAGKGMPGKVYN